VRERFKNYLRPDLNHTSWTAEEDSLLLDKYAVFGPQWRVIKSFFANRSDVNVKNRWAVISARSQHFHKDQVPAAAAPAVEIQPPTKPATQPTFSVSLGAFSLGNLEHETPEYPFGELWHPFP
jgi:hypothetical protein